MEISTSYYTLSLDDDTGAIRSFRGKWMPERDMLSSLHGKLPLFTLQYLDAQRGFHEVSSNQAQQCAIHRVDEREETYIRLTYTHLADLDLDLDVTIRCPKDEQLSYWSFSLYQHVPLTITSIHFPFIVVPYRYGKHEPTYLLVPRSEGQLYRQPRPEQLQPDYSDAWQFTEDQALNTHYPGTTFAQFLAYYNALQGIYLGSHDAGGRIKIIKPVHHESGIRLGMAHITGWEQPGEYHLGYEVALGVFAGDWCDAADLYREWYETKGDPGPRLSQREDVPQWLLDSPLHIVMRIQGELDHGPATPHPEFVPYENALPLLDRLAQRVDAPLVPIIMSWERHGPWVYPDSFPVTGGDESLLSFTTAARTRGWHVGTYCNGTRWAIGHKWTGYDGQEYYHQRGGENTVCLLPDGTPWRAGWDRNWRPSYLSCIGVLQTQNIALEYVGHLLELGLDWIQFLDQNCGAATFPCYSQEHGHVSAPGQWMSETMNELLKRLEERAATTGREIVFSVESAPNDHFRAHFPICDVRPDPEGNFVPLYQYLFHEYILTQAAFSLAPDPYWMQIKTAQSFVLGDLLTAIMGPGGRLMAWAGHPWASWDTPAGDQDGILTLLRRSIALRRGLGRDFLTFGRLLRPCIVQEIKQVTWICEQQVHSLPAVFHAHWKAADGRTALALANWTDTECPIHIDTSQWSPAIWKYNVQEDVLTTQIYQPSKSLPLVLPSLSVALLEYKDGDPLNETT